jgi:hypothetical protein
VSGDRVAAKQLSPAARSLAADYRCPGFQMVVGFCKSGNPLGTLRSMTGVNPQRSISNLGKT